MSTLPTGEQYEIVHGQQRAVVTEVGAGLRHYSVAGHDLVHGFPDDGLPRGCAGEQLLPWPNRIRDGRYRFGGVEHQLALTEPDLRNAIHGLARHVPWSLVSHAPNEVTQRVRVFPQPGWPGLLEAEITHRLDSEGLQVSVTVANRSEVELPFGYGAHPYLTVGEASVDEVELTLPAASYLLVDERLLPVGVAPVAGTPYDLRSGRRVGNLSLDTAFTDLERDADDRWRVRLRLGERTTELWGDGGMTWLQVFTGGPYRTWGIAAEPMTCGPDAFNDGPTQAGRLTLSPGQSSEHHWGIQQI